MLQIIIESNERFTPSECAQMAIEGGCGWLQLRFPELSDEQMREHFADIIELCREAEVFLTIEDNPVAAKDLAVHGVHMNHPLSRPAAAIREELGAEAIIGVGVESPETIVSLGKVDIDYVCLSAGLGASKIAEIIDQVKGAGCKLPIVVSGDMDSVDAAGYIAAGADGVATSSPFKTADDPVSEIKDIIEAITDAKQSV